MRSIYNTPNGISLNSSGKITHAGTKLENLAGFMGFALDDNFLTNLRQRFPLEADFRLHESITSSMKVTIDSAISSILRDLAKASDYKETSTGFELISGVILHDYRSYTDMFQDTVQVGYSQSLDPSGDLNLAMSEPYNLSGDVYKLDIVKKFDRNLNILSMVSTSEIKVKVFYSEYDMSGNFIQRMSTNEVNLGSNVEVPKVANRLHKIDHVLLIYRG